MLEKTLDPTEIGLPASNLREIDLSKRKPTIEDWVFFAAAQRVAEKEEDGLT